MKRLTPPALPDWLDRQLAGMQRYVVDVGDERIHVMEHGEGRPVVCFHGNPSWGFLYRKVAERLRDEPFRVIMPDLVGLGLSTKPRDASAHTLENHTRWMTRLVDALEIEDWIGVAQDWGGPICLSSSAHAARGPAGLVLMNTVIGPPRPGFKPTLFHRLAHTPVVSDLLFRGLGFPQIALWMAQGDRRSIRGEVARAYRWPLRDRRDNVAPLALARMVPDSMDHPSIEPLRACQEFVESFDGPIGLVWGVRDPILGSVVRWVEKVLPDARSVHTDAGHFLQEEVPGPISEAIRQVADDVPADA